MSNPAIRIIEKCGGAKAVALMAGVDVSRVHRWAYPKARGGSDGIIPARHQSTILNGARAAGIELAADEFIPLPEDDLALTPDAA